MTNTISKILIIILIIIIIYYIYKERDLNKKINENNQILVLTNDNIKTMTNNIKNMNDDITNLKNQMILNENTLNIFKQTNNENKIIDKINSPIEINKCQNNDICFVKPIIKNKSELHVKSIYNINDDKEINNVMCDIIHTEDLLNDELYNIEIYNKTLPLNFNKIMDQLLNVGKSNLSQNKKVITIETKKNTIHNIDTEQTELNTEKLNNIFMDKHNNINLHNYDEESEITSNDDTNNISELTSTNSRSKLQSDIIDKTLEIKQELTQELNQELELNQEINQEINQDINQEINQELELEQEINQNIEINNSEDIDVEDIMNKQLKIEKENNEKFVGQDITGIDFAQSKLMNNDEQGSNEVKTGPDFANTKFPKEQEEPIFMKPTNENQENDEKINNSEDNGKIIESDINTEVSKTIKDDLFIKLNNMTLQKLKELAKKNNIKMTINGKNKTRIDFVNDLKEKLR
jgi:hypothetical protein